MRWDKNTRDKAAAIIMEKSNMIGAQLPPSSVYLRAHTAARNERAKVEYFRNIGFESASPDEWCVQRYKNGTAYLKSCRRSYLVFMVTADCVMKVSRDIAEKILVFGLP